MPWLEDIELTEQREDEEIVACNDQKVIKGHTNTEPDAAPSNFESCRWQTTGNWSAILGSYLLLAIPCYLRPGGLKGVQTLHATSYLDALRGYAAWITVNYHRFDLGDLSIMQLPFVRTISSGKGMVDVFFVISGFVLSQRMLTLIRSQQKTKLIDNLASSIFRRYLRLYIPSALASFVSMLLVNFDVTESAVPRLDSFSAQFWDWLQDLARFSNPFAEVTGWWHIGNLDSKYLGVLWTIPVEFRGSMIVYLFCAGTAKLSTNHRLVLCAMVAAVSFAWQASYVALFLSGIFLAEVSLIRHPGRSETTISLLLKKESDKSPEKQTISQRFGYSCLFIFSIFLLGQPRNPSTSFFPWPYLGRLVPTDWDPGARSHFWFTIASPLLIFSVDSSPMLQRPFLTSFSQYLGELSFGIYVMHQLVIGSLYMKVLIPFFRAYFTKSTWILVLPIVMNWLVVFWVAHCFERVDKRVVNFGRRLQTRYFKTW